MNKLVYTFATLNLAASNNQLINYGKEPGAILDLVTDDEGNEFYWIMAPKPGYDVPFDLRRDELMIL